jgi:hypothetical protein
MMKITRKGGLFKERPAQFRPEDSVEDHKSIFKGVGCGISSASRPAHCGSGHHAPSKASTHPRYKNELS